MTLQPAESPSQGSTMTFKDGGVVQEAGYSGQEQKQIKGFHALINEEGSFF